MILKFYIWLMGVAGALSAWAWRKHVKIIKVKQQIQHNKLIRNQKNKKYLEELKIKLYE